MSSANLGKARRRLEKRGNIGILSHTQSVEMRDRFKRVSRGGAVRKRGGEVRKGGNHGESLPLRSLLDSRRMRREHTGRVSKDVYGAAQGEGKSFHHGCITILVVGCLKRCLYPSTGRSCLSTVVAALRGVAGIK